MLDFSKVKTEWDFTKLLSDESDTAIEEDLKKAEEKTYIFINKWKGRDDYLSDPKVLKQALDEFEELMSCGGVGGNAAYYIALKSSIYQDDPVVKARENKIDERTLKSGSELDFFGLRIARIPQEIQSIFLDEPELAPYKHLLKNLFDHARYLLTEPEERILSLMSPTAFGNWVKMTSEFVTTEERDVLDEDGNITRKNFSDLLSLLASPNIKVRESASNAIDSIFEKHIKVGEAEMNSVLSNKKTSDYLRGYTRPDQARIISDDLKPETVDLLLDVVSANNKIAHRYYALKSKLLNLPKLRYFERNILYKGMDKSFSFEQAVKVVYQKMTELSPDFGNIFERYLYQGQIDVFTKKSKSSSEFCASGAKQQPVYVMLNYGNKIEDVSTIAHEMGHAINDEIVKVSQNAVNEEVPLCLAETASTFFEDFILDEVATTLNDEEKLALSIYRLDSSINTVFRQVACYKFEQDLHKNYGEQSFLSKDALGDLFVRNMAEYCGPSVEMLENTKMWWLHWSHIRSFFYVYSYAFGYLVSKYMQDLVRQDPGNIDKVKTFLSAGCSKTPKEILSDIGIDVDSRDFWQKGVNQIEAMLDETEQFAKKLGKI